MSLKFNGQTPSKIKLNGNEINKIKYNGNVIYTSTPPIVYPTKGDLINIDIKGNGTPIQFRVLKNVNDTTFEIVSSSQMVQSPFGSTNTYENSLIDVKINTTLYDTFSTTAKNAIVDKNISQYSYTSNQNVYNATTHASWAQYNTKTLVGTMTRHCYLLDVEDVETYYSNVFSTSDLYDTFFGHTSCALRSKVTSSSSPTLYIWWFNSAYKYIHYNGVSSTSNLYGLVAMQIDLSKIPFSYVT